MCAGSYFVKCVHSFLCACCMHSFHTLLHPSIHPSIHTSIHPSTQAPKSTFLNNQMQNYVLQRIFKKKDQFKGSNIITTSLLYVRATLPNPCKYNLWLRIQSSNTVLNCYKLDLNTVFCAKSMTFLFRLIQHFFNHHFLV